MPDLETSPSHFGENRGRTERCMLVETCKKKGLVRMSNGKRYNEAIDSYDREELYEADEAISMSKRMATAKFDETIELVLRLGICLLYTSPSPRD